MNIKTGIDIIEVSRIKESIESLGDNFLNRVFTKDEINYCNGKKEMTYQHYAARFAAKEAFFKAVSDLLDDKFSISWKNVEIIDNKEGKPCIAFIGISFDKIISMDISLSHLKDYAVASVTLLVN